MEIDVGRIMKEPIGLNGRMSAYLCLPSNGYMCTFMHREMSLVNIEPEQPRTCKYWIEGNCAYGQQCRNLHAWSDKEGTSPPIKETNKPPKKLVWWTAPPVTFFKINCDGARTMHENKAAAGGVVRDWKTNFVFGFSTALRECSVLDAELSAIKIGMKLAISRGCRNLIVESDSQIAVQNINAAVQQSVSSDDLVSSIIEMTMNFDQIRWNHVFREANSVADGLAKHGLSLSHDLGVKVFDFPPQFIVTPLWADRCGKIYCR